MALECKVLMRPKVRFSERSESTDDSDIGVRPFNGPKIRNIITLDKPVKLIYGKSRDNIPENRINIPAENPIKDSSSAQTGASSLPTSSSAPCLKEINSVSENLKKAKPCKLLNNPQISSSKSRQITVEESTKKNPSNPPTTIMKKNSDNINKRQSNVVNFVVSNKENVSKRSSQRKEQNVKVAIKPAMSNQSKVVEKNKMILAQKSKDQTSTKSSIKLQPKLINSARTRDTLSNGKLSVVSKPQTKSTSKLRTQSHAQSEMVKNISKTIPNVYIGPGIPRNRTRSLSSALEKLQIKTDVNHENKLDRPEYNSIMFTIKKLREAKKEKLVTDIDSLPKNYKNLCMKKMSSALNFSPGESIYHDLIDLSITDNKLPMRLMRSKDPEPRQKDLEPRLSDFFVPQYARGYSESVKIRPRSPQIVDNSSAFKISDRIFSWKTCLEEL